MKRKILIIICLILFISISAVSAADDSNQTLSVSLNDVELMKSAEVGTFADLSELITDAENASEISLDRDYRYDGDEGGIAIAITKNITINGNGHTIDGNHGTAIFRMDGSKKNVILNNITFVGGLSAYAGGAINSRSDIEINSCNFINCSSLDGNGGAIYCEGTLTVRNSIFSGNVASYDGGAIYSTGNLTAINSSFINNMADCGKAICGFRKYTTLDNCTFINDDVFYFDSTDFDLILNSSVVTSGEGIEISAVFYDYATGNVTICVNDDEFIVNITDDCAKLILSDLAEGTYDVTATYEYDFKTARFKVISGPFITFSDLREMIENAGESINLTAYCIADDSNPININKNITINGNGNTIDGNYLMGIFSISNGANAILNNITFTEGNGFCGGAIYVGSADLSVNDCTFMDNTAVMGGAIHAESASLSVNGCTFTNNSAQEMGGGAIYVLDAATSIDGSLFSNNQVLAGYGRGAAICFESDCGYDVLISNSIFNSNRAQEFLGLYSDGVAHLESSDGFLDHQIDFILPYDEGKLGSYPNITVENVSYNEFKNQSFTFSQRDLSYGIDNETIRFEVFKDDTLLINTTNVTINGRARVDLSSLSVDYYLVNAYYNGLMDSATVRARRDSNFTMSVDDIRLGEDLIISFDISPEIEGYDEATGTCRIWSADSYDIPEYLTDFSFRDRNITIQFPYLGTFIAVLDFGGDDTFRPEKISQSFNVYPADYNMTGNRTIIKSDGLEKNFGDDKRFYVTLSDIDNNPLKDRQIIIKINGVAYTRTTDDDGVASMAINLDSGWYSVVLSFTGDETYLPCANASYISVTPTVVADDYMHKYCRDPQAFEAQFLDSNGNALTSGEATFNINGVFYKRAINSEGYAKLNINLDQGDYIITAANPVTGEMKSSEISISPTITQNHDLVKYYRNDSAYVVRLDGNGDLSNKKVSFNINGVFYERYSDENGYVKLNINLEPGEYVITAEYNGCRVSNNITVLPVLNASDLIMDYGDGSAFLAYLVDGEGYYYPNQEITFNINGVFYTRTTDYSGIARLNIRLMPGEYIITSSYNGANIANRVTVLS